MKDLRLPFAEQLAEVCVVGLSGEVGCLVVKRLSKAAPVENDILHCRGCNTPIASAAVATA